MIFFTSVLVAGIRCIELVLLSSKYILKSLLLIAIFFFFFFPNPVPRLQISIGLGPFLNVFDALFFP